MTQPKRRDYFDDRALFTDLDGLKKAAAALEYDAALLSKSGMRDEARSARHYAKALKAVVNGATWSGAFEFPAEAAS